MWISTGKSFVVSASTTEMSWIVPESEEVQAGDGYANFAQRDFLASVVRSYSSDLL